MQIGIVGAGIGGLGAALALARAGHQVEVLERAASIEELGAGIQIGANGCRILKHWGLLDQALKLGDAPGWGWLSDGISGRRLCRLPLSDFAQRRFRFPYLHMHRADLLNLLLSACRAEPNIVIRLNAELVGVHQTASAVQLATLGGAKSSVELLIGADGMRSSVARLGLQHRPASYSGRAAWRALIEFDRVDSALELARPGIWMAPGKHLVHYPLRQGRLLNLVVCADYPEPVAADWDQLQSAQHLQRVFADMAPPLRALLAPLEQSYIWGLFQADADQAWVKGRVLLLGDAAHAMLPSLAQGAVMALEDGVVLAQLLGRANFTLEQALACYQRLRQPRVQRVQRAAERNMRRFHTRGSMERAIKHGGLRLLGRRAESLLGESYSWLYGYDPFSTQG